MTLWLERRHRMRASAKINKNQSHYIFSNCKACVKKTLLFCKLIRHLGNDLVTKSRFSLHCGKRFFAGFFEKTAIQENSWAQLS